MTDRLRIAIAAGGTAGHVNPALALAECLRDRGHEVRFFGEERRLEGRLVPQAGFDFFPVHVTGFDRQRPWTLVTALAHLAHEERRLARAFRDDPELRPDVAIGFGAYVELPLMRAARRLGIPIALHEQNSVPGLANKKTARDASLIAIAHPSVAEVFRRAGAREDAIRFTGNPVRRQVLEGDRARGRAALGVPNDGVLLVVFGGSLGAHHLNERMASLKGALLADPAVYVLHSTGEDDFEATRDALALTPGEERRYRVRSYIEGMGDVLAAADLVLSRAGASSIAEIAALSVPSVLVPYPFATADHQTTNAHLLVDAGAAVMFADPDIDGAPFAETLGGLIADADRRARMREAAAGLGQAHAAERLADELEGLV